MRKNTWLAGNIEMLLLAIVARGPLHGYAIIERLRLRSSGLFDIPEGTVYPALYRLEELGLLASESSQVGGRPRRTYRLTRAGGQELRARHAAWAELSRGVDGILKGSLARAGG